MKIYVIAWDYAYEGYGVPEAAYATREQAEDAIAQYDRDGVQPAPEIFELEVQGVPEPEYEWGYKALGQDVVLITEKYARTMHERWGDKIMRRPKRGDWEEVEA